MIWPTMLLLLVFSGVAAVAEDGVPPRAWRSARNDHASGTTEMSPASGHVDIEVDGEQTENDEKRSLSRGSEKKASSSSIDVLVLSVRVLVAAQRHTLDACKF